MKLNKLNLPKALGILSLTLAALLSTTSFTTPVYAAETSSKVSQGCINLIKSETAKPNSTTAKVSTDFKVTLNGKAVTLSDPIVIDNGSTLLPVRAISNLLGIQVDYDSTYKVAIASTEDTTLEIPLGLTKALNNSQVVNINNNARSVLFNAKTYLPVRFVSEQLSGVSIDYIAQTKTISIITDGSVITPPSPTETPAPTTGNSPQAVFDAQGSIQDIDSQYIKKFSSIEEVKAVFPNRTDKAATYVLNNMNYISVTMDITDSYNKHFDGANLTIAKARITVKGSNQLVVFKDGTYIADPIGDFGNGKTIADIKYFAFSVGSTIVTVTPGVVNLENLIL